MPITLVILGEKEATMQKLTKMNLAPIVLEPYTPVATLLSKYTKVVLIDTPENRAKVQDWFSDDTSSLDKLSDGTLLHYSFGALDQEPAVTRGVAQDGGAR